MPPVHLPRRGCLWCHIDLPQVHPATAAEFDCPNCGTIYTTDQILRLSDSLWERIRARDGFQIVRHNRRLQVTNAKNRGKGR